MGFHLSCVSHNLSSRVRVPKIQTFRITKVVVRTFYGSDSYGDSVDRVGFTRLYSLR